MSEPSPEIVAAFHEFSRAFDTARRCWQRHAPSAEIIIAFDDASRAQATLLELLDGLKRRKITAAYKAGVPVGGG